MKRVRRDCRLVATAFILAIAAAANICRAENSASTENSPNCDRSSAPCCDSLLHRLLTWPEPQQKADDDNGGPPKEEPLESDRPDFTDSPKTVGRGRLQIESGYQFTRGIEGDLTDNAHDLPELLVRYGVAERLELRVAWDPGFVFDRHLDVNSGQFVSDNGGTDIELGFKYALTKQDHWRPESGVIVMISAPVGAAAQTSGQVDTLVNYLYSWQLNKKFSLGCSSGCLWTAESSDHFTRLSQSASLDYDLTEKLHIYNEAYGLFRIDFHEDRPQYYYDGGVTYLVTPNFQLDWRAGVGLNTVSDRFFTGCGFSVRW